MTLTDRRDPWYAAPTDIVEWSMEPKAKDEPGRGSYLIMRLIIDRKKPHKNQMRTRTFICHGIMERARNGDFRDILHTIAWQADLMIRYRALNESLFPYTLMSKGVY